MRYGHAARLLLFGGVSGVLPSSILPCAELRLDEKCKYEVLRACRHTALAAKPKVGGSIWLGLVGRGYRKLRVHEGLQAHGAGGKAQGEAGLRVLQLVAAGLGFLQPRTCFAAKTTPLTLNT